MKLSMKIGSIYLKAKGAVIEVVKPLKGQASLIPVFVAQSVSFILFLVFSFLSIMFLSNEYFQLSLFTNADNFFKKEKKINQEINVLYIDPESYLRMGERYENRVDVEYRLLSGAIRTVSIVAKQNTEPMIVALDYALLKKVMENEEGAGYRQLIDALAGTPDNLILVFGGTLTQSKYGTFYLRSDIIYNLIKDSWALKNSGSHSVSYEDFSNRFYLANIHYSRAVIRTGLKEGDIQAAVGYYPCINVSYEESDITSLAYSLPFAMFMLGEVITTNRQLRENTKSELLDKGGWKLPIGSPLLKKNFEKRFKNRSGREFTFWATNFLYYNFDKTGNIKKINRQYYTLYNYFEPVNKMASSPAFKFAKYFFIAKESPPQYLSSGDDENIITPVYQKDRYTGQIKTTPALMTHITALDNLLDKESIIKAPPFLHLFTILLFILLIIIFWRYNLLTSILSIIAGLLVISLYSYFLFTFSGLLLPVQLECIIIFTLFVSITLIRVMKTVKMDKWFKSAVDGVFTDESLKCLGINEIDALEQRVRGGILMVIAPKESGEGMSHYNSIFQFYINSINRIIEAHGGSHKLLFNNCIAAFWLEDNKAERATEAAFTSLQLIDDLKGQIKAYQKGEEAAPDLTFDIILHLGEFNMNYYEYKNRGELSLGGEQFRQVTAAALLETGNNESTIHCSSTFKERLLSKRENSIQYHLRETKKTLFPNSSEGLLYKVERREK